MPIRKLTVVAVTMALMACTKTGMNAQTEYNSSVITEAEIVSSGAQTAYDAVKKLRSNFLASRGKTTLNNTSTEEPSVYLDDQLFGLVNALKQIPATQVAEIRLYRAWEATTKYGTGNMGGVIAIFSRH
ncbi:MAG: hypothetical protein H0U64_04670 [Gemmatimonadaceae bacterium]|nr:hypothetical protein [Gemmatimonadaceae bacterium]